MRYLSKRFISILLSFTFVAIALVLYINFIKPTYADIKIDQGRLAEVNKKNQDYTDIFSKLKGVSDDLKKSSDLQNRVSMVLPLTANAADSLNQVTAVAAANGLAVSSVDIVDAPSIPVAVEKGDISILKATGVLKNGIRVSGSYAQIKSFLQGAESGVRLSSIRSVKIDRVVNSANPDSFSATVEVETYYQTNQ